MPRLRATGRIALHIHPAALAHVHHIDSGKRCKHSHTFATPHGTRLREAPCLHCRRCNRFVRPADWATSHCEVR
jgi:hypothetical protein